MNLSFNGSNESLPGRLYSSIMDAALPFPEGVKPNLGRDGRKNI